MGAGAPNRLWGGAAVSCICFSGGAAVVFLREAPARTAMLAGCVALFAGAGLTLIAITAGGAVLFLGGSVTAPAAAGIAASLSERGVVARRARVTPPGS